MIDHQICYRVLWRTKTTLVHCTNWRQARGNEAVANTRRCNVIACIVLTATVMMAGAVSGQQPTSLSQSQNRLAQKPAGPPVKFIGSFHLETGTRTGFLILKAEISKGNYIYSLTQKGSPPPSKISVGQSEFYKVTGRFHADRKPVIIEKDPVFKNRIEKHSKTVQFFIPIEIAADVDPGTVSPEMRFTGQVCSDSGVCMPFRNRKVTAKFGGFYEPDSEHHTIVPKKRR